MLCSKSTKLSAYVHYKSNKNVFGECVSITNVQITNHDSLMLALQNTMIHLTGLEYFALRHFHWNLKGLIKYRPKPILRNAILHYFRLALNLFLSFPIDPS